MRFLVDENLPVDLAEHLQHLGHEVLAVSDSPLRGSPDYELVSLSREERRIIVTRDIGFGQGVAEKPFGILLLRVPETVSTPQLTEVVSAALTDPAQLADCITVISPGRLRRRRFRQ